MNYCRWYFIRSNCNNTLSSDNDCNKISDIDECAESLCGNLKCLNHLGSYSCICPTGFPTDNNGHCEGILSINSLSIVILLSFIFRLRIFEFQSRKEI